jgi:hypothetical protein
LVDAFSEGFGVDFKVGALSEVEEARAVESAPTFGLQVTG